MSAPRPLETPKQASALPGVRAVCNAMRARIGTPGAAYRQRIDGMCAALITSAAGAAAQPVTS